MRQSEIKRKTNETDIALKLTLGAEGKSEISTGSGFLDHMLTLFAKHGRFDIELTCRGDVEVDLHHTTEDIGIALGQAFAAALGEKRGIMRYADIILPMDEALIMAAVDISGRPYLSLATDIKAARVGNFDTELVEEFWRAFAMNAAITLHIKQLSGSNTHHIIEGIFKACARCLGKAVAIEEKFSDEVPSTKGVL